MDNIYNPVLKQILDELQKLKLAEQDKYSDEDCDNLNKDGEQIFDEGVSQGRFEAFVKAIDVVKEKAEHNNGYSFKNAGVLVKNVRSGSFGIVLRENTVTGQIQVLERVQPPVINTHDRWKTLEIVPEIQIPKFTLD